MADRAALLRLHAELSAALDAARSLLAELSRNAPELRPGDAVRFRHFVRHAYAVSWDVERIGEVLATARSAWPALEADLAAFLDFLSATAQALAGD